MSFTLHTEVKEWFFDRAAVQARLDAATRKSLSKAGAFVRRRARSSLRRRKRPSRPGETPSVHSRDRFQTLKNIVFAFDGDSTVIVGPVGFNQRFADAGDLIESEHFARQYGRRYLGRQFTKRLRRSGVSSRAKARRGGKTVPQLLEEGGTILVAEKQTKSGEWIGIGRRKARQGQATRLRRSRLERRPFMLPALEKERPNFANLWARSVSQ